MRAVTRPMTKKLLREIWARKGSMIALALIMSVGVGCFVGMLAVWRDMEASCRRYYQTCNLADFTVDMKRAPRWTVDEVATLPNVRTVQGRVSIEARVDLPDQAEPIAGRAISLPEHREDVLNDILLRSGTYFSGTNEREVILNHAFAHANGLVPGSRVKVLLLDKQHDVLVVGTAMSPEFVYVMPPGGGLAPDPARYGIMYFTEDFLRKSCNLEGAYNQLLGLAFDNSKTALRNTLSLITRNLDAYGVLNTTPRHQQPSVQFLRDELKGLKVTATTMPVVFLAVGALVLNVLLGRMVAQERTVIGTLRALGYTRGQIRNHYLAFGVTLGAAGGLLGVLLGLYIESWMLKAYRQVFALPDIRAHLYWDIMIVGFAISTVFAILGTLKGVQRAADLEPAEAMRPAPPEIGGAILIERVQWLWRRTTFRWKMILRTVFRNPFRSLVSVFSSLIAAALVISAFALNDALHYLMNYQFAKIAHEDVTVSLREPRGATAIEDVRNLPAESYVEGQLAIVCDMTHGPFTKRTGVTALPFHNRLCTPLDSEGDPIVMPPEGLVLTTKLAEILHARVGDVIRLRPLVGRRETTRAPIVAVVNTFLGMGAYAEIGYLSRLIGEVRSVNRVLGRTFDRGAPYDLLSALKKRPQVVGLSQRRNALTQLNETFGRSMGAMIGAMVFFAGLVAFGSVLNASLVSLSERQREVGTLRVLGYTTEQVLGIFAGESYLLGGVGIALGLAAGCGLAKLMSYAYNTEMYRFPTVIYPSRLVLSAALMIVFVGLAQLVIYRMIKKLEWLEVLNARE